MKLIFLALFLAGCQSNIDYYSSKSSQSFSQFSKTKTESGVGSIVKSGTTPITKEEILKEAKKLKANQVYNFELEGLSCMIINGVGIVDLQFDSFCNAIYFYKND